jgi:hypothetical protein
MRLPIRLRLTLVFTLCMAALLSVTGTFVYLRLGAELLRGTDAALLTQADAVAAGLGQQGAAFNPPSASPGGLTTFTQVLGPGGRVLESSPALAGHPAVAAGTLPGIRAPAYVDARVPESPGPLASWWSPRAAPSRCGCWPARRRATGTRCCRRCWSSCSSAAR